MNSILRIYVPSTLNVAIQHTEISTVTLDLTPDISKKSTFHDQVVIFIIQLIVITRIINLTAVQFNMS